MGTMMKRLLLALFLCILSAPAFALTCTVVSPQLKDNAGTTFNAPYVDDATGTGDCQAKVAQGLPGAAAAAWYMQGTAASGAALAGNPVRIGISDGTNAQNWLAAIALGDGVNRNNTGAVA